MNVSRRSVGRSGIHGDPRRADAAETLVCSARPRLLWTMLGVALALMVFIGSRSSALANEPDQRPKDRAVIAELEIPRDGDPAIVSVEAFGQKLRFLVRTSSPTTTFDVRWLAHLGSRLRTERIRGADGKIRDLPYYRAPALQFGPLVLDLDEVAGSDLSVVSESVSHRIDGFLGADFVSQFVVTLDSDRGLLQLRSQPPADPGEEVALLIDQNGCPLVRAALGGKRGIPFAICTGSPAAMLLRPSLFVELMDSGAIRSTNPTMGTPYFGVYCGGIAEKVALGPFMHDHVAACTSDFDGLGMDYLGRYVVTLDVRQRKAYFKPGKAIDRIDRLDQSGMEIVQREGKIVIAYVSRNSPAGESGILVGDVMQRINERAVAEFSLLELRRLLRGNGDRLTLDITRGDEPLELELVLRNYQDAEGESKRRSLSRTARVRGSAPAVIAELDVGRHGEPLVVPLVVDGFDRPVRMLVDTGAPTTSFRSELRRNLGARVGWRTVATPDGLRTRHEQVRVGAATLCGVPLSRASTGHIEGPPFEILAGLMGYDDLDGILGIDLLGGQIIQLDFDAGKLRLLSAVGDDCGDRIELIYSPSGAPAIAIEVGGTGRHWFIADTGCVSWSFCDDDVFRAMEVRGAVSELHQGYQLLNSQLVVAARWRGSGVKIGAFADLNVGFASAPINALGLLFLSRYLVTFDLPGGAIYLKEGKLHNRREPFDASGLQIIKNDGRLIVYDVSPGSPAAECRIMTDDVILAFDGRDATKASMFDLQQALSRPGETVNMTFRRRGETYQRKLLLRDFVVNDPKK